MNYQEAWVHFLSAAVIRYGMNETAVRSADTALEYLKERESKGTFEKADTGYRQAPIP